MHSSIAFLAQHLELGNIEVASFVIMCFNEYVSDFLRTHPHVLDPHFAQIKARVHLTMAHPPVGWLWTQHQQKPQTKQMWGHEEHATAFVLRVLGHLHTLGYYPEDRSVDTVIRDIHQRLCVLQSLYVGNRVWVENEGLEMELRRALQRAMEEMEVVRVASGVQ